MDEQHSQNSSQSTPPPQMSQQNTSNDQHVKPEHKKLMSVLAYLGILIVIPFIMAKDDPNVKFHLKQGAVLFCIEVIIWALGASMMLWQFWPIISLINLGTIVLAIVGIINVVQDKEKELPLVGGFAKHFNF